MLLNLERKLEHLPEQEKMVIKALLVEFAVLFPDVCTRKKQLSHSMM